ncbi:MAG TPA: UDP-N-acetylmuramoyl-tripeptide--D-alanyl-D-alanine ligase [Longimicrobiaceae bacterium]|nr:UDP-N-acetylmuramoyl-tripeptide--D-alanyl-D-alanine ligase [Longimicrobiaceae bacterium]
MSGGFRWTAAEVQKALEDEMLRAWINRGVEAPPGEGPPEFTTISTDTRKIPPGSLFVALRGERFDAHDFLGQAAEAGATGAVVSRVPADAPGGLRYFEVDDTRRALGQLARHRRRLHRGQVVGIAGSNGKTTAKDLVRAVLAARFRVHATEENLNNQVGVPLTLLAAPDEAEVIVVEMGTNEPGEIAILAGIVEPDFGIVTSIGEEHLEKLGSLEGVLEEELALLGGLRLGGVALVAEDPPALPQRTRAALGASRTRVVGLSEGADLHPDGGAEEIEVLPDGTTRWSWEGARIHLLLPGRHNVRNALFALGLAREMGISREAAVRALARVPRPRLRNEWHRIGSMRILADCYNSNPPSLAAAIDLLASLPASGRKVAVVGTMREMGEHTRELHRRAAEQIAARVGKGVDLVVATGEFATAFILHAGELGERLVAVADPVEAYDAVSQALEGNETILLKASRGERLERWLPLLERDYAPVPEA